MWTTEDLEIALARNPDLKVAGVNPYPKPIKGQNLRPTMRQMDKAFSEVIRKRAINRTGGCERCHAGKSSWKQLQTSHFWGRGRKMVRWDEDNAVGLCGACHLYLTAHPAEHTEWFKKKLGDLSYQLLELRAQVVGKPDIEGIWLWLKKELGV